MTKFSSAFSFLWLTLKQYKALSISGRLVYLSQRAEYLAQRTAMLPPPPGSLGRKRLLHSR